MTNMHQPHLSGVDLNLLLVLGALLDDAHVTRAGRRLGLSQSATSHALARLRDRLADPLFVRSGRRLLPTPRAEALREPLRDALERLGQVLAPPATIDAKTLRRTFTISAADYTQLVLLPGLTRLLAEEAPAVDLWVREGGQDAIRGRLLGGETDVAITPDATPPPGIRSERLFRERFVVIVRKGHPLVKKTLPLALYASLPHAFIAPGGTRGGVVDEALAERGLTRRVAVAVPNFLVVPHLVASSDLIATVGARVAERAATHLPLRVLAPPLKVRDFEMRLLWHQRYDRDGAHELLRSLVRRAAADL